MTTTTGRPAAPGRRRGPSMADVAREANVSGQTVSRVSNGRDNVDGATRDRVLAAMKRGLAGVVTDGGVRDLPILERLGFPVFGGGLTPAACDKDGPGEINFPIAIGDVPILPGDIVVADDDGVVIVPRGDVPDVLAGIEAKRQSEEKRRRDIAAGLVVPAAVVAAVDAKLA